MTTEIERIFSDFGDLLQLRFSEGVPTTEDSIRYTLFAAMLGRDIQPHEVVLEYPHPAIDRAKIDTWIPACFGEPIAIEFKYDRDPPGGKNQPKTQKAGAAFKDLSRLLRASTATKCTSYFVYVTTREMALYFRNSRNGHDELFDLMPGASIDLQGRYFKDKPATFLSSSGGAFEASIIGILGRDLANEHALRIWEVHSL